jgi:hypothetical protein
MLMTTAFPNYYRYECSACEFTSVKYSDYSRHIATKKHNKRIVMTAPQILASSACGEDVTHKEYNHDKYDNDHDNGDDDNATFPTFTTTRVISSAAPSVSSVSVADSYACRICNRTYSARNSAWYHEKKCKQRQQTSALGVANDQTQAQSQSSQVAKDEIIDRLLKDNAEMMKIIKDIVPRIGTTMIMNTTNHNKFNVNVFLNEQCKDAVNISDFVNSIRITMQDLHVTEERGLVESISNVLVQGLNDMDVYKRPIHCTDLKRDILYVKDNEQWERDETQEHIRKSVNDIAYKQILSVENWKNGLPNIHCDEKLQLQYNTLLLKTLADTGEKDIRKIVKTVCKQVYLPDAPQIQPT